jgi:hypothetical protein
MDESGAGSARSGFDPPVAVLLVDVPYPGEAAFPLIRTAFETLSGGHVPFEETLLHRNALNGMQPPRDVKAFAYKSADLVYVIHVSGYEHVRSNGTRVDVRIEPQCPLNLVAAAEEHWKWIAGCRTLSAHNHRPKLNEAKVVWAGHSLASGRPNSTIGLMREETGLSMPLVMLAVTALFAVGILIIPQVPDRYLSILAGVGTSALLAAVAAFALAKFRTRNQSILWKTTARH